MNTRKTFVFWSTRETINSEIVSIASLIESILAVVLYISIAEKTNYFWPLIASIAISPLVLLRSPNSTAVALRWFGSFVDHVQGNQHIENNASAFSNIVIFIITPLTISIFATNFTNSNWPYAVQFYIGVAITLFSSAVSISIYSIRFGFPPLYYIAYSAGTSSIGMGLSYSLLWIVDDLFYIGIVWGLVYLSMIAASIYGPNINLEIDSPKAKDIPPELTSSDGSLRMIVRISGILIFLFGAISILAAGPIIFGGAIIASFIMLFSSLSGSILLIGSKEGTEEVLRLIEEWGIVIAPLAIIVAVGIFFVSIIIRVSATLIYIADGVGYLSTNFRKLIFCTSPTQQPELIPGIEQTGSSFTLRGLWLNLREELLATRFMSPSIILFYGPIVLLWFLPAWFYRITIKSTCWFWWPLAYLLPSTIDQPTISELRWRTSDSLAARSSIIVSLCMAGVYLAANFARNPHEKSGLLSTIEYFFIFDETTNPWSVLSLIICALGVSSVFLMNEISWRQRPENISIRHLLPTGLLVIILVFFSRIRFLLSIIFWVALSSHIYFLVNSNSCIFEEGHYARKFKEIAFGELAPNNKCRKFRF